MLASRARDQVWDQDWFKPWFAVDPTKSSRHGTQDMCDFLFATYGRLCSGKDRNLDFVPPPVPFSDPALVRERRYKIERLLDDAERELLRKASCSRRLIDTTMLLYAHSSRWQFIHLRFALMALKSSSSILHFPQTVIRRIFFWATSGEDNDGNSNFNNVVRSLSATCRSWRRLAAQQPHFWSRVATDSGSRQFLARQHQVLRSFPESVEPIHVDLALRTRHDESRLVIGGVPATPEEMDRMKGAVQDVVSFLTARATLYISRCTRIRILGTVFEWGIISSRLEAVRSLSVPILEELVVDIVDAPNAVETRQWKAYMGSTRLRVLRIRGVVGLWEWPTTSLSSLAVLELDTVSSWIGFKHLLSILRSASRLHTLRLRNLVMREEAAVRAPILLPAIREMALVRLSASNLQALLRAVAVPHLVSLELRDTYSNSQARVMPGSALVAMISLVECPRLRDLRVGSVAFDTSRDVRKVVERHPDLRHFQIDDATPRAIHIALQCLVDTSVATRLEYFRYSYPPEHRPDDHAAVLEIAKEVQKNRRALRIRYLTRSRVEHTQFGQPVSDYSVELSDEDD